MSEIRYMISDAARQVGVEAHVLRSWEEELDIKVGRTELGHRYYTDKTIYIMKKVKELQGQRISAQSDQGADSGNTEKSRRNNGNHRREKCSNERHSNKN